MLKRSYYLRLALGFLLIGISIYGSLLLRDRPGLAPEIENAFKTGNLLRVNQLEISKNEEIEFVLSRRETGESLDFYIRTPEGTIKKTSQIIPFYSQTPFPLIFLFVGFISIFIGVIVFILRADETHARIFYWTALCFSSALIMHGGFYLLQKNWMSFIPGVLFYIVYPVAPALLFHFSLTFYSQRAGGKKLLLYVPTAFFSVLLEVFYLTASINRSIEAYRMYNRIFFYFRLYLLVYVLLTFTCFILSYIRAGSEEKKSQVKWILYGMTMGLGPFILLYQIWQVLKINPPVSEELVTIFFLFVPIGFAFSIVKFKLLNIELIINRSLVYSILTVVTVSVYIIVAQLFQKFFSQIFHVREMVVSGMGALIAAAVFHPARRKIQDFVDISFFRVSYDYRECIRSFNEIAHTIMDRDLLIDSFFIKVQSVLPIKNLDLLVRSSKAGKKIMMARGEKIKDLKYLVWEINKLDKVLAQRRAVKVEEKLDFSKMDLLKEKEFELIIPFAFKTAAFDGAIAFGKKRSGEKFSRDDIQLLLTMTNELTLNLERLALQEEVIYEKAEKKKLNEINRMKTDFISSVSHEIRTPMSSIQGLSEVLQSGKIKDKKKQADLLDIMTKECARLSRFLQNIIDFGKIEQKKKSYRFEKTNICQEVKDVMGLFIPQLESGKFTYEVVLPDNPVFLNIDRDSVKQVLINLFDNAIKYSVGKKQIKILIKEIDMEDSVEIHIRDQGIGIPLIEKKKIFKGFYRAKEATLQVPKGVGLGLKISRHIMDAHAGVIEVESKQGFGSNFILRFPKL